MKAVVQRVRHAQVKVDGQIVGEIGLGLLTLLGFAREDTLQNTPPRLEKLMQKLEKLRIFDDEDGKMNRPLSAVRGSHLVVSQFTLYGDMTQGNRPGFTEAAHPTIALPLYEHALEISKKIGMPTQSGRFGANMKIELLNDGPVTFVLEL